MNEKQLSEALFEAATQHQAGRLQEAEALYRQVLSVVPKNPEANHNLGVLAMQTGKGLAIAIPAFQVAWESDPAHHQHWQSYVRALVQAGNMDAARRVSDDGIRRGLQGPDVDLLKSRMPSPTGSPKSAPAPQPTDTRDLSKEQSELIEHIQNGRFDQAEKYSRSLISRYPQHGLGWKGLGAALLAQQRHKEALDTLQRTAQLMPQDVEVQFSLGNLLLQLGLLQEAEAAYTRTRRLNPGFFGAHQGLAVVLQRLYKYTDAEIACRNALVINPNAFDMCLALGDVLRAQSRVVEAAQAYRQAMKIKPGFVEAYRKLGTLLFEQQREEDVIALCRQMLVEAPDYLEAYTDLAQILLQAGRLHEAAEIFGKVLALRPEDLVARASWLFCCNYLADLSPQDLFDEAQRYGHYATKLAQPHTRWQCSRAPKRLRVGIVSGDLREHPVGYFLENVISHSNRERVEWIAYSTHGTADALTQRLQGNVDQWKMLIGLGDQEIARQIHADGVHVLIDLAGHSAHNGLSAFAWRPAPVQASWLGYFATTGLAEMDYFIADAVSVPPRNERYFTEKVWTLPDTRLCFTPPLRAPDVSATPALKNGWVTFGSFQVARKLNDAVLTDWAKILSRCENARLRLQSDGWAEPAAREAFRQRAENCGIDTARLDLFNAEPRQTYLAQHAEVDILLDTFPFPGGTTTCEALWMGVPTVSLNGETLVARQGASLLTAAGLGDWVAASREAYIALALDKAGDIASLNTLRLGLREQVKKSPLCDAPRFARNLEDALWGMWKGYAKKNPAR